MRRRVVMLLIVGVLAGAGCKDVTELLVVGDDPVVADATPIEIHTECVPFAQIELDPVSIKNIGISGDLLTVTAEYAGGCADHAFTLHACDGFLESLPPQSPILLAHDDPDDPCDAIVTEELVFHLAPLKDTYRADPSRRYRTLALNVYESSSRPHYEPRPLYDMGSD